MRRAEYLAIEAYMLSLISVGAQALCEVMTEEVRDPRERGLEALEKRLDG
jgi:hypothetical protein